MAWRLRDQRSEESVVELFNEVHKRTPDGETRRGIAHAFNIRKIGSISSAARTLGNGSGVTCPDTVPFAIWCAANHLYDYRQAIAATASACLGRISRTRAIDRRATVANIPKMASRGTRMSRRIPNPQSARPPQLMLTMFMMP